jgi:hypothetical protein
MTFEIRPADPPSQSFTRRFREGGASRVVQMGWHGTRGGYWEGGVYVPLEHGKQVQATENWFADPANDRGGWGGSADFLIGLDHRSGKVEVVQFHDWERYFASWAAGYGAYGSTVEYGASTVEISVEVAESFDGDPLSTDEVDACVWLTRHINERLAELGLPAIPSVAIPFWNQLLSEPVPAGHITHARLANGQRLGKSDIGEANFLRIVEAVQGDLYITPGPEEPIVQPTDPNVAITLGPGRYRMSQPSTLIVDQPTD